MRCDRCGKELAVGEWPFCGGKNQHGFPDRINVIDDQLPGGARWMQNLGHEPVWVETKTQLKQELDRRGLRLTESANHNTHDKSPWATRTRLR